MNQRVVQSTGRRIFTRREEVSFVRIGACVVLLRLDGFGGAEEGEEEEEGDGDCARPLFACA